MQQEQQQLSNMMEHYANMILNNTFTSHKLLLISSNNYRIARNKIYELVNNNELFGDNLYKFKSYIFLIKYMINTLENYECNLEDESNEEYIESRDKLLIDMIELTKIK